MLLVAFDAFPADWLDELLEELDEELECEELEETVLFVAGVVAAVVVVLGL